MRSLLILILFYWSQVDCDLNLPKEHYEFYFKNNPSDYEQFCSNQQVEFNCSRSIEELKCWGYEKDKRCSKWSNKYPIQPYCYKKYPNYEDLKANKKIFYDEADFGYVKKKREELKFYCRPSKDLKHKDSEQNKDTKFNESLSNQQSELKCTDYLRFCEGKNIFINFRRLKTITEPMRYRGDVLEDADIGGVNCELDAKLLNKQSDHKSPLQSWYEELEHFKVMNSSNYSTKCDLTIDETIYIMKLDATVNLYHHLCDFINLYASLHLTNDFSLDKQILIWDTREYKSNFGFIWNSFTNRSSLNLNQFRGKKVCFKHVVFPLLPRLVYGLYYNMPLIKGCKRSGLFHAFNRHVLNGLNILKDYKELFDLDEEFKNSNDKSIENHAEDSISNSRNSANNSKDRIDNFEIDNKNVNNLKGQIRITFLSRSTAYRKVLNEDELVNEIRNQSTNYKVIKVDFNHQLPFKKQLEIISSTDILIGIHGAGLTHCLFLPDWSVLFELFNCDDESCYKDLARLRGVKYITWKNRRKLKYIKSKSDQKKSSAHLKFTDYHFDKNEFIKRLNIAIDYVNKKKFRYLKKYKINSKLPVNNLFESPKTEL